MARAIVPVKSSSEWAYCHNLPRAYGIPGHEEEGLCPVCDCEVVAHTNPCAALEPCPICEQDTQRQP